MQTLGSEWATSFVPSSCPDRTLARSCVRAGAIAPLVSTARSCWLRRS
jgi:hypothetical protein